MANVNAISPIDGRYSGKTKDLAEYSSERALMRCRLQVEAEYLIFLSEHPGITGLRHFSGKEKDLVRRVTDIFDEEANTIKAIETKGYKDIKATNHDVKAIEYFMKDKLKETSLNDCLEWIHFALTSEDVNNIAYSLMLSDGIGRVIVPAINDLYEAIEDMAQKHKEVAMLARTHGQPATPTTFGKEFKVFSSRIKDELAELTNQKIRVKLNGATGNYNAHYVAYPKVDWIKFTEDFIEKFNNDSRIVKFEPNLITTQIESHDSYAKVFHNLIRLNNIIMDFDLDMWRYISDEWIKQKPVEGEVGSSTMPHKVNPIDFENSEGNLDIANSFLNLFATRLQKSRLQRDLSDSTVERNFGSALAYGLIAYKATLKAIGKIAVNEKKVISELNNHPEVISEAIQTILRRECVDMPYEKLKQLTRGKKITLDDFYNFIEDLEIPSELKEELHEITPENYTGIAKLLVDLNF